MFQSFLLLVLLALACVTVFSDNLRRSIIFLGSFSLTIALVYLHYNAPDVALAEAAIGVGLSTIMYLVALKKFLSTIFAILMQGQKNSMMIRLMKLWKQSCDHLNFF